MTRKTARYVALGAGLWLVGCGGRSPRAVEVTEAWTSGDERALGIEETPAPSEDAVAATPPAAGED